MDFRGLSSTDLQDIDANDIIADNIMIWSDLNVSGTTNLFYSSNVQDVNVVNSINILNNFTSNDLSILNIDASKNVEFMVNNTQLTQIKSKIYQLIFEVIGTIQL